MTEQKINKTWRQLVIPFIIGIALIISGILWHTYGSKKPNPQTLSLFVCVAGVILCLATGVKMIKFKKYLSDLYK